MALKKKGQKKRTSKFKVDYDTFWKKFIEEDIEDFMDFAFKKLHQAIDYSKGVEFVPKELHKIMASYGKKGTRTSDLLIKVFLKPSYTESGKTEEVWLLIHIEIEMSPASNFSFRMFSYFYRALDKYEKKVIALAVFPGEKPQAHHKFFEWKRFGTEVYYKFNCLDAHEWTEQALLEEKNIVALALLACRRAIKTRNKYDLRYTYKRELLELITKRNYPLEKARRLFNFVFYVMFLPNDLDKKIAEDIFEQKKENMSLTQIPPEVLKRADVFFEVYIEKTTGKPYAEYLKEQEIIKSQLKDYRKQLDEVASEKQKAEQEKQKAEQEKQKAEQEKQKAEQEKQKAEQEKQKAEQEKQKAEQEKQKAEQEKQKAEQEKLLFQQKIEQEQKNTIYELSKLLSSAEIATALKMKEKTVIEIIASYDVSKNE